MKQKWPFWNRFQRSDDHKVFCGFVEKFYNHWQTYQISLNTLLCLFYQANWFWTSFNLKTFSFHSRMFFRKYHDTIWSKNQIYAVWLFSERKKYPMKILVSTFKDQLGESTCRKVSSLHPKSNTWSVYKIVHYFSNDAGC